MSATLTVQLSRARAIMILGCLLLAGVFLFLTGTVSGLLAASKSGKPGGADAGGTQLASAAKPQPCTQSAPPAESHDPVEASNADSAKHPASTPSPSATAPVPSQPPPVLSANASTPSAGAPNGASGKAAAPAASNNATTAANADADTVALAVKVCSFATKESAENMVKSLAAAGFHASLLHSVGAYGKSWYVVRLGPFTSWSDASAAATQVTVAENVRPMIGPAR